MGIIGLSMMVGVSAVAAASSDTFTHKQPVFGEDYENVPAAPSADGYEETNEAQQPATADNYDGEESSVSVNEEDLNVPATPPTGSYDEPAFDQPVKGNNANSDNSNPSVNNNRHHNNSNVTQTHYDRSNSNRHNGNYNSCCY